MVVKSGNADISLITSICVNKWLSLDKKMRNLCDVSRISFLIRHLYKFLKHSASATSLLAGDGGDSGAASSSAAANPDQV